MAGNVSINTNTGNGTTNKNNSPWKYNTNGFNYNILANGDYDIDLSDLGTYDGSRSMVESRSETPKYYVLTTEGKKFVDSADDAPQGFPLYKNGALIAKTDLVGTGATGRKKRAEYIANVKQERINAAKADQERIKIEQKNETDRMAATKVRQKEEQVKLERENAAKEDIDFILSDNGFSAKDSSGKELYTPYDLFKKMSESGIVYEDAINMIKGTKWETGDKRTPEALEKYYPEITRGAERRETYAEAKALNPDLTEEQYLAAEKDDKDGIVANAKKSIAEKKSKAEEEAKIAAEKEAEDMKKKADELQQRAENAKEEAKKRKASTDADKLAREFEEKYNFPIAQFWNPGWSVKKKVLLLGELLANLGANITNGAVAGFHGQKSDAVQSPMAKYFSDALAAKNQRYQTVNQEKAKSQANVVRRDSLMSTMSDRYKLSDKEQEDISVLFEGPIPSYAEFDKALEEFRDESEKKKMYEEFKRLRSSYGEGAENYGKQLGNEQASVNLSQSIAQNMLKNEKDASEYINTLRKQIIELQNLKLNTDRDTEEDYWKAAQYVMNFVGGVETANSQVSSNNSSSNSISSVKGWNVGADIGFNGIGINGGYQNNNTNGRSLTTSTGAVSGKQLDVLRKYNIPVAEKNGREFIQKTEETRKAINAAIDEQIRFIQEELIPDAENVRKQMRLKDGIIKAPGQKQWLVREDGSIIGLDPEDNVYATKNELTTEKDDGSSVIPLNQTDVVEVMNKLGYSGGTINKDFNYYLTKLKK